MPTSAEVPPSPSKEDRPRPPPRRPWGLIALGVAVVLWLASGILYEAKQRRGLRMRSRVITDDEPTLPVALQALAEQGLSASEYMPFFVFVHRLSQDYRVESCVVDAVVAGRRGVLVQMKIVVFAEPTADGASASGGASSPGSLLEAPRWVNKAMRRAVGDHFGLVNGPTPGAAIVHSLKSRLPLGVLHFSTTLPLLAQPVITPPSHPCCFFSIPLRCAGTAAASSLPAPVPHVSTARSSKLAALLRHSAKPTVASALIGDVPVLAINLGKALSRRANMESLFAGVNGGTGPLFVKGVHYLDPVAVCAVTSATMHDQPFSPEEVNLYFSFLRMTNFSVNLMLFLMIIFSQAITLSHLVAAQRALMIIRASAGTTDIVLVMEDDCDMTDPTLWWRWLNALQAQHHAQSAPFDGEGGVLRMVAAALEGESSNGWGVLQVGWVSEYYYYYYRAVPQGIVCGINLLLILLLPLLPNINYE